jgi:hypothetical protein
MSTETKHTKDAMRADFIATDGSWVALWEMTQQRISSLEAQNKELRELLQDALPYVQQQAIKQLLDKALSGGG